MIKNNGTHWNREVVFSLYYRINASDVQKKNKRVMSKYCLHMTLAHHNVYSFYEDEHLYQMDLLELFASKLS